MDFDTEFKKAHKKHFPWIKRISGQMYLESSVCDLDDLEQAGLIGLINAIASFDAERAKQSGTKKSTYYLQCIRNAIMQEANKFYAHTSLPHNKRLRLNAFKKLLGRGVEPCDIKTLMKMSDAEYDGLQDLVRSGKSVAVPDSLVDEHTEDNAAELFSLLEEVSLTDDERQLLRFKLEGKTYSQIAEHYGLSRETMRKRVHKVIEKIRNKAE